MFFRRGEKIKRCAAVRQRGLQFLHGRNLVADFLRVRGLGGRTLDLFRSPAHARLKASDKIARRAEYR